MSISLGESLFHDTRSIQKITFKNTSFGTCIVLTNDETKTFLIVQRNPIMNKIKPCEINFILFRWRTFFLKKRNFYGTTNVINKSIEMNKSKRHQRRRLSIVTPKKKTECLTPYDSPDLVFSDDERIVACPLKTFPDEPQLLTTPIHSTSSGDPVRINEHKNVSFH